MVARVGSGFALRWTDPSGERREFELPPEGDTTIGRSRGVDLILDDSLISRRHARVSVSGDGATIEDLGSRNGILVNTERVTTAELRPGDEIRIGQTTLELVALGDADATDARTVAISSEGTVVLSRLARPDVSHVMDAVAPSEVAERGVVPQSVLRAPLLSEAELEAHGVPVEVVGAAALGAGLGSFVWVDLLRISGVPEHHIAVVGVDEKPHGRYARLCANSQIPLHERLRSNSDSCPDNVWGFPGYAVREIWRELKRGNVGLAAVLAWRIFGEPAIAQTYTPRSGDVFRSIEREAARIGWNRMLRFGRVLAVRKSDQGRLVAICSASDERTRRHFAVSARFMHLGVGYPAIQLLPDLAEYRERTGDQTRVVNAYEPHDHVYTELGSKGGTVLLRGRGIVASRIVQRLWEERGRGAKINIVHLHRSRLTGGHREGLTRRKVQDEWEFQPFNWPKGGWGGQQRQQLERATDEERKRLLGIWGGTTTADRSDWKRMVAEGLRDGWYRPEYGVVRDVQPQDGRVITRISTSLAGGGTLELMADYVIDCTGLVASPDRSPLLADLIGTHQVPLNALGRLGVNNDFELEALRHGSARLYCSGAMTLGGPFSAVDSFLGLQYAAYRAVHAMRDAAPGVIRRLGGSYSIRQWLRWARGVAP